jgi:hypothetical protein
VEAERKEDVLSKIQKTKRKNITPTALPPKNEVKPLEKKDPSLASTSFKALRPGRLKLPSPKDFKQEIQPPKIAPSRKQLRPPSETVGITASSSQSNSAQSLTRDRGSETKDRRVSSEAVKTVASLGTDPKPLTGQTQTVPTATAKKQDSAENQESSLKNKGESGRASDKSGSARFKVSSQPASEVFLNGQRMGTTVDATTASAWFPVSSGKQQLELRRKGYATHKMTLDLRPDESLSVPMIDLVPSTSDPTSGSSKINLTLRVNMLPAQVTVRQLESNNTQVFALKSKAKVLELDPGRYVIKVEHNGETREREVNLSTNQGELTFSADFKEAE